MKITIACVGKIKEKFYRDAVDEYIKRLSRYMPTEIKEVSDEKAPESLSEKQEQQIMEAEGQRLLKNIKDSCVVALDIKGKKMTSPQFAEFLSNAMIEGNSHVTFVIGGSLGLSQQIKDKADYKISFSDMTFPHQLMRVVLLEQIYRANRIIKGEPYHK